MLGPAEIREIVEAMGEPRERRAADARLTFPPSSAPRPSSMIGTALAAALCRRLSLDPRVRDTATDSP
ncbi:MAG: hypothetical protein M0006_11970 [Magnetospirillum sp.]|nr:hypothetical protein [Magnetospirillum sp.]